MTTEEDRCLVFFYDFAIVSSAMKGKTAKKAQIKMGKCDKN